MELIKTRNELFPPLYSGGNISVAHKYNGPRARGEVGQEAVVLLSLERKSFVANGRAGR